MRLLFIGPNVADRGRVSSFGTMWGHYLYRELTQFGHQIDFFSRGGCNLRDLRNLRIEDYDHIIALGSRFVHKLPIEVVKHIRGRLRGALCDISDGPAKPDIADVTFIVSDSRARGNLSVGWAADPELFVPRQSDTELGILVDHPYYGMSSAQDWSSEVDADVYRFQRAGRFGPFTGLRVRRLVDGGAVDWSESRGTFSRQHVPIDQLAPEYGAAHVFIVTHREATGLTCLETAQCGALVVAKRGAIPPDRLATIEHIQYEGAIPWERVIANINVTASRQLAARQTWNRVALKIALFLTRFKK